jgi:ABC-type nitrate/sulfonate/bicarbonate transport system substrate-binding protein
LNRKIFILIISTLLVLVSAVFFSANLQHLRASEKYSVSISIAQSPLSAPFYVAKSINAFKDTCVTVHYDEVIGGQRAFAKVMNGETDFGTSSDSVIAFKSLTKSAFVTHAMFVQSDNDVKLMTRSLKEIKSVKDLKGKKVGVTRGTASHYFLSMLLAMEGLTIDDVELHHYKPEQLANGFINNEVDAIVPWEPFAFNAVKPLNNQLDIHDTKSLNNLSFNLISQIADSLLVEKAACILQGLSIAIDYIASHPEKSKKIVIDKLNLTPAFIDWVWSDYIFMLELNQSLLLNIKSQAKWAIEMKMSEHREMPNVDAFVDSRAMLQVSPGSVNLPL